MNSSYNNSELQQSLYYKIIVPEDKIYRKKIPSNSSTVIKSFFQPEIELVKKLNFFIPEKGKIIERNKSKYNPNITKDEAAISKKICKNIKLENF
jgi:hypothetical protein